MQVTSEVGGEWELLGSENRGGEIEVVRFSHSDSGQI